MCTTIYMPPFPGPPFFISSGGWREGGGGLQWGRQLCSLARCVCLVFSLFSPIPLLFSNFPLFIPFTPLPQMTSFHFPSRNTVSVFFLGVYRGGVFNTLVFPFVTLRSGLGFLEAVFFGLGEKTLLEQCFSFVLSGFLGSGLSF